MIPRGIAKETITIYNFVKDQTTYKRTVIPDCVWKQDSHSTYRKTGVLSKDDVSILIPYNPDYFSVSDGQVFTGEGWTIESGPELKGTYIVKGDHDFNFPSLHNVRDEDQEESDHIILEEDQEDVADHQEIPGITEDDLVKDYIINFEKSVKYKRPKEIVENFIGTKNLWYIEVRC